MGRKAAIGVAAVTLAALALWVGFRLYTGICLEDALITYRYAANIARGNGFVFNPGEKVLGTTTPLLTLILAFYGALLGVAQIPFTANFLMIGAALGAGWLMYPLLRRAGVARDAAWAALLFFFLHRDVLWTTTGGMETPLVLLLMAASLYAVLRAHDAVAAAACGLLVLTRIDGAVWAGCIVLWMLSRGVRNAILPALTALATVLPWILFAGWYFGSPVPNSVLAKQAGGSGAEWLSASQALGFLRWYARALGMGVPPAGGALGLAFWPGWALVVLGTGRVAACRERRRFLILPLFLTLYGLFLYAGNAPRQFLWYLLPATWTALLLGALGLEALVAAGAALGRRWAPARAWALAAAALSGAAVIGIQLYLDWTAFEYHRKFQANEIGLRRRAGEWIRDRAPAAAAVAMEAIGYQGTAAQRRVIDLAGLISPEVVHIRRASRSNAEAFHRVLQELQPDYLILRSFEADENRHFYGGPLFENEARRAEFRQMYREVQRLSAPYPELWQERARLTIFARTANATL